MARIDIPRTTAADERATYGPNTAQVELLLDGIARAQQVHLWSIGLHFTTCMQESGTVTLRNAVKASRFAAQLRDRVEQWEHARQDAADAAGARAASLGIIDHRQVSEVRGLLSAAAGMIVAADYLAVEFQREALDAVEHYLGITFDLPAPTRPKR
jgi:hypothetical protein